ncbi:spermine oxidase-like isoform X2 [Zophobas morio]|uniref:spermine oxidase-like isoform X2 n=1 Tax=Zophobas morio TaxID=2755281 RepID=UPI003082F9F4
MQLFYLVLFLKVYSSFAAAESPSVIIVGAGAAGIAAATTLLENSITNVTVLEAKNRIGGRIHSVDFCGGVVEVGAQYCHGENGNLVYQLLEKLDVLESSNLSKLAFAKLYTSNGHVVATDLAEDLVNTIFSYDEYLNASSGNCSYNSGVLKKYSHDEQKQKIVKDALKFVKDAILIYEGAFSLEKVASRNHFVGSDGDQNLVFKNQGYRILLDVLMKSYPNPNDKLPIDDKILLNKTVTKITWNKSKVVVETSDNVSLIADHVIFTPSIGVLKEQMDSLFDPHLPKQKKEALDALGFDGVMKIILHFPTKWWKDDDYAISFLWSKEDLLNSTNEFPDGPSKDGISWLANIPSLVQIRPNYNVLIAWYVGDLIPEIEKLPDDILLRGCNYLFKKFLGKDYNVTDADKVLKSQWCTDPHVRGTYSFEKVGYSKDNVSHNAKLAEPLVNEEGRSVLLFAGEATNPIHYSTVHGAVESGKREAERIIELLK